MKTQTSEFFFLPLHSSSPLRSFLSFFLASSSSSAHPHLPTSLSELELSLPRSLCPFVCQCVSSACSVRRSVHFLSVCRSVCPLTVCLFYPFPLISFFFPPHHYLFLCPSLCVLVVFLLLHPFMYIFIHLYLPTCGMQAAYLLSPSVNDSCCFTHRSPPSVVFSISHLFSVALNCNVIHK